MWGEGLGDGYKKLKIAKKEKCVASFTFLGGLVVVVKRGVSEGLKLKSVIVKSDCDDIFKVGV